MVSRIYEVKFVEGINAANHYKAKSDLSNHLFCPMNLLTLHNGWPLMDYQKL